MVDVTAFIAGYGPADRTRIEFLSNGEVGPKLRDANASFRGEVCRALRGGQPASDELIRDLYDAESTWSAAAWCVRHEIVAFLASELLRRGGADNVRYYLECIWRGQDCYLSSLCVQISPEQRATALAKMAELIAASSKSVDRWRGVMEQLGRTDTETDD